ncbi:hypothetical protein SAMN04515671_3377 [Nakamurella panacisegetis]|uniref:Uncharacterized protein n=1 Tax=Nakamurella panacisegetis TaxID=1090615 RepID=A0A1H0R3C5_9ACTN|nr:Rv2175c family DNA-binding protein [Nakamurella panacisegetis]SDP23987.1 hypothetical protein SAMN04515671_3377 [Nakamurella panacisegetis]
MPNNSPSASGTPDSGPPKLVPVPDIASALGLIVTRVHQLLRERQLVATRVDGVLRIPAEFVQNGAVVKGLPSTITLLSDAGYTDPEIIDWLFTPDDTLPGRPITALRENRGREVHRRAQASGF